jgi:hypothetical protein
VGVTATTTNPQDVMAYVRLDGVLQGVENYAYSFPGDIGATVTTALFGTGRHTVEFVFYRQSTTTEIGRASTTVLEWSYSRQSTHQCRTEDLLDIEARNALSAG